MKKIFTLFSIVIATGFISAKSQSIPSLKISDTFHISSPGGWDYLAVSPTHDWLYVSHGTQVNILNKNTGDSVGVIENTTGVHGITFDVENKKGFTSNGRLNNVSVFDINTNKVLAQIATGQNPDAILYDSYSKKILTCNGRSHNLTVIDPVTDKAIDSIDVGGKPETAISDGEGNLFVNVEDKNEIIKIDTKTFKVISHWSISPGEGPTGLAYDAKNKRLFAGCKKMLVVVNAVTGNMITTLPIGDGCDGVAFDKAKQNIYTSNGSGTLTVIHEISADKFSVIETLPTKRGARTITIDNKTGTLYLPTADFEPQQPNEKGRPKMIPGTFQVLVIAEK